MLKFWINQNNVEDIGHKLERKENVEKESKHAEEEVNINSIIVDLSGISTILQSASLDKHKLVYIYHKSGIVSFGGVMWHVSDQQQCLNTFESMFQSHHFGISNRVWNLKGACNSFPVLHGTKLQIQLHLEIYNNLDSGCQNPKSASSLSKYSSWFLDEIWKSNVK